MRRTGVTGRFLWLMSLLALVILAATALIVVSFAGASHTTSPRRVPRSPTTSDGSLKPTASTRRPPVPRLLLIVAGQSNATGLQSYAIDPVTKVNYFASTYTNGADFLDTPEPVRSIADIDKSLAGYPAAHLRKRSSGVRSRDRVGPYDLR
jgi:hypothetical protein